MPGFSGKNAPLPSLAMRLRRPYRIPISLQAASQTLLPSKSLHQVLSPCRTSIRDPSPQPHNLSSCSPNRSLFRRVARPALPPLPVTIRQPAREHKRLPCKLGAFQNALLCPRSHPSLFQLLQKLTIGGLGEKLQNSRRHFRPNLAN